MAGNTAFVDAEALLRQYLNTRTSTLVGAGKPLPLGVHLHPIRSPGKGAYAVVQSLGGWDDPGDSNLSTARLSVHVYASTKEAAATAAIQVANEFRYLDGAPAVLTGGTLRDATNITGPLYQPDGPEPRYIVDSEVRFTP